MVFVFVLALFSVFLNLTACIRAANFSLTRLGIIITQYVYFLQIHHRRTFVFYLSRRLRLDEGLRHEFISSKSMPIQPII